MSRPVDEKIAKLTLDNADFKRKTTESIGIFAKLQAKFTGAKNLNLDASTKSVAQLGAEANKVSLRSLMEGAGQVGSRFSAMGAIATGALMKIGATAVSVGANLIQSMTVAPIMDGYRQYENKMNYVMSLQSALGKDAKGAINGALQDLNKYALTTRYSVEDMNANLAQFVNAGVSLEDATVAIKGWGNQAAAAGASTQGFSASLQFGVSQALAMGKMTTQNWMSIENANMATQKFKDTLVENGKAMGKNVDLTNGFRESLSQGWLTNDVFIKSMQDMANDKSLIEMASQFHSFGEVSEAVGEGVSTAWSNFFETLMGDVDEVTPLWTKFGNAIGDVTTALPNALTKIAAEFVHFGGRGEMIKTVTNSLKGLAKIGETVKQAFFEIFPPKTAAELGMIAKNIGTLSEKFIMSGKTANQVKTIFKGVFSIFDSGIRIAKALGKGILDTFPKGVGRGALDFAEDIAKLLLKFNDGLKQGNAFKKAIEQIGQAAGSVAKVIWNAAGSVTGFIKELGKGVMDIGNKLAPAFDKIKGMFKNFLDSFSGQDLANVGIIGGLFIAIKKLDGVKDMFGGFLDSFSGLFGSIKDGIENLGGLKDVLEDLQTAVKSKTLMNIAMAIALLAGSLKLISTIPAEEIFKSLETMGVMMAALVGSLKVLSKFDMSGMSVFKSTGMLVALGIAVLELSTALKVLSKIKPEELGRGMLALVGVVTTLTVSMGALNKLGGKMGSSSLQMIALAGAVVILTQAVKQLAKIDSEGLVKGISAVGAILLELAVFLKIVNKTKFNMGSALGIVAISGAILVMVKGIQQIAAMPVNTIVKGLATIGAILLEIAAFVKLTGGSKTMAASVGMVLVAGAINMLVDPIQELGSMSLEELAKGLGAMGIALLEVVGAMALANGSMAGAAAIIVVAGAVKVFVPPFERLAKLKMEEIGKGLLALAGAFAVIGVAGLLITPIAPQLMIFSAALVAVGVALGGIGLAISAFTFALSTLASLGVDGISRVVDALGRLLDGLTGLIPKMVDFGVTAVVSFAGGLAEAVPSLVNSGMEIIVGVLEGIGQNIYQLVDAAINLVVEFANAIGDNAQPALDAATNMVIDIVNGIADTLREHQGELAAAMMNITEAMLEAMVTGLQAILTTMFGWIPGFEDTASKLGDGAREKLRETFDTARISQIGKDGGQAFADGAGSKAGQGAAAGDKVGTDTRNAAKKRMDEMSGVGSAGGQGFANGINGKSGTSRNAGNNLGANGKAGAKGQADQLNGVGASGGQGFANGLGGKAGASQAAGARVGQSGKHATEGADFGGAGRSMGNNFATGLGSQEGAAGASGSRLSNAAKTNARTDLSGEGNNAGSGFAAGISSWVDRVGNAAASLASRAKSAVAKILDSHSPSREMRKLGRYGGQGFQLGFTDETQNVEASATYMARSALDAVNTVTDMLQAKLDATNILRPVIKPTLDMSDVTLPDWSTTLGMGASANGGSLPPINITVNATSSDPEAIARSVERVIVRSVQS